MLATKCLNNALTTNLLAIIRIYESYFEKKRRTHELCHRQQMEEDTKEVGVPIRLIRLSGNLTILLAGLVLAAVVFVAEKMNYQVILQNKTSVMSHDVYF